MKRHWKKTVISKSRREASVDIILVDFCQPLDLRLLASRAVRK